MELHEVKSMQIKERHRHNKNAGDEQIQLTQIWKISE